MNEIVLKTSADDLYELVKSKGKISVEEAAKILKIPVNVVQSLVDFLVEEKIFGVEYKFTTPYVYISQGKGEMINFQNKFAKKITTKDEFFQKASKWNIPFEKMNDLWKSYIKENLNYIKEVFYRKANSRNISKEKIDALWKKYMAYMQ